ncbi:MFS transporter [Corynebacterium lizhenjunii]|uniref:MFS transporter n=1 Tax=Corynebacterium lizhenjunii TaxID=2709394 RepID=A0A7T0PC32_9CORY|nr:MFS transporter [Corynebacterium lizhenjunii]QPK79277.1 MFS transporter [Corynebacterium lizhenjunii]
MQQHKTDHKTDPETFWTAVRRDHPDYIRWFVADTASALGASLISIPMAMVSLHVTGSLSQAGLVGAATSLGSMIMTIPAGMIIDRFNKKRLLFLYGLSLFLIWAGFSALLVWGVLSFPLLLLFGLSAGLITGTFGGLTNAILRFIIGEKLLVAAQGRNQTRDSIVWMAGLPLGGLLYGIAPVIPFVAQAVAGLGPICAAKTIEANLEQPGTRSTYSFEEFWADTKYSLTWIWKYPTLRAVFGVDLFANFANFFFIAAVDLWLAYLQVEGWIIGLVSATFSIGMVVGGLVQDRLIRLFPASRIIWVTMLWQLGCYLFLVAFSQYWPLIAVATFAVSIPAVAWMSYSGGYLVLSAPPEKIGKCSAGARLMMGLMPVLASAGAGVMLSAVGFRLSMAVCAACAAVAWFISTSQVLRRLPKAADFDQLPVYDG